MQRCECDIHELELTLIFDFFEVSGHSRCQVNLSLAGEVHQRREEGRGSDLQQGQ